MLPLNRFDNLRQRHSQPPSQGFPGLRLLLPCPNVQSSLCTNLLPKRGWAAARTSGNACYFYRRPGRRCRDAPVGKPMNRGDESAECCSERRTRSPFVGHPRRAAMYVDRLSCLLHIDAAKNLRTTKESAKIAIRVDFQHNCRSQTCKVTKLRSWRSSCNVSAADIEERTAETHLLGYLHPGWRERLRSHSTSPRADETRKERARRAPAC